MGSLIDPETGKPRLLSEQCATCVGRPGNPARLRPGRLKQLIEGNQDGTGLICHETLSGPWAFCRWFWDTQTSNYQRTVRRLGGPVEVPPPPDPRQNVSAPGDNGKVEQEI